VVGQESHETLVVALIHAEVLNESAIIAAACIEARCYNPSDIPTGKISIQEWLLYQFPKAACACHQSIDDSAETLLELASAYGVFLRKSRLDFLRSDKSSLSRIEEILE